MIIPPALKRVSVLLLALAKSADAAKVNKISPQLQVAIRRAMSWEHGADANETA